MNGVGATAAENDVSVVIGQLTDAARAYFATTYPAGEVRLEEVGPITAV